MQMWATDIISGPVMSYHQGEGLPDGRHETETFFISAINKKKKVSWQSCMKNFTQNFFTEMRDFFLGRTTWEFVIIVLTNLYNFNIPPS